MISNKAAKAIIAAVAIIALVVGGEGARRPKLATRPTATVTVVIL